MPKLHETSSSARLIGGLSLRDRVGDAAGHARLLFRVLRSARKRAGAYTNALLSSVLVSVLLVGTGPVSGTWASFTASQPDASNMLATAKQFTISDVAAVAKPGGTVVLTWSAATWALGGYSVRHSALIGGPFTEITGGKVAVTTFTDHPNDGDTWYYRVYGLSQIGGAGTGSDIVAATADATPPTVLSTSPAEASTALQSTQVAVTFSEAMNQELTGANFALVECATSACSGTTPAVSGTRSWPSTTSLAFAPAVSLAANQWYGIQLTAGAADLTGNAVSLSGCHVNGAACAWSFEAGVTASARGVKGAAPQDGSTNVPLNARVSFQYTDVLSATGQGEAQTGFSLQQQTAGGVLVCYVYSGGGLTPLCPQSGGGFTWDTGIGSSFAPTAALLASTQYGVSLHYNDVANLVVDYTASWTTGSAADSTRPSVTSVVPTDLATDVSPTSEVQVHFSEEMDVGRTASAFSLQPWSTTGTCAGGLGSQVAGATGWTTPATTLRFTPVAALTSNTCYRLAIASTAADAAGNLLLATPFTSDFTVLNGTPPAVTISTAYYYPGAIVTAAGTNWTSGATNVVPSWDGGTVLDAVGAVVTGGSFSGYTFGLPKTATVGSHNLTFTQGSAVVSVPITVQTPSRIALSTPFSDVSPGSSPVITATVFDGGTVAVNAWVTFTISTDAGGAGSFGSFSPRTTSIGGITNGSGQILATLHTSNAGPFTPISVTASSGTASAILTIIDPLPLPPSGLHLSATDRLLVGWSPSSTTTVTGYRIYLGPTTHTYNQVLDAGPVTSYTVTAVQPGQTYFVVVRAYDAHGALSDPSAEVSLPMPGLAPTSLTLAAASPTPDGQTVGLTATLLDQYGHPLPATQVSFSTQTGATVDSGGSTTADGTVTVQVTRVDPLLASATVRATSGQASAQHGRPVWPRRQSHSDAHLDADRYSDSDRGRQPDGRAEPDATGEHDDDRHSHTSRSYRDGGPTLTPTIEPSPTPTETAVPTPTETPELTPATVPTTAPTAPDAGASDPSNSTPTATLAPATQVPANTAVVAPSSTPPAAATPTAIPTATGTATATPLPTSTPNPAALAVGQHEDDDSKIAYAAGWSIVAQSAASGGHYHATLTNNAQASFKVDSRAGSLVVRYLPTGNGVTLDVFQDGNRIATSPETDASGILNVALTGQGDRTIRLQAATSGSVGVTFDRVDVIAPVVPTPSPTPTLLLTPTLTATPVGTLTATPCRHAHRNARGHPHRNARRPTPDAAVTTTPVTATPGGTVVGTPTPTVTHCRADNNAARERYARRLNHTNFSPADPRRHNHPGAAPTSPRPPLRSQRHPPPPPRPCLRPCPQPPQCQPLSPRPPVPTPVPTATAVPTHAPTATPRSTSPPAAPRSAPSRQGSRRPSPDPPAWPHRLRRPRRPGSFPTPVARSAARGQPLSCPWRPGPSGRPSPDPSARCHTHWAVTLAARSSDARRPIRRPAATSTAVGPWRPGSSRRPSPIRWPMAIVRAELQSGYYLGPGCGPDR